MKATSAIALISIVASGCSPLAPRPDKSRFFILSPISSGPATGTVAGVAGNSNLTLGVGPIYFPGYLRRPEVVTLASANQVDVSADDRWAEPLDKNFERVVTENLTELLDTRRTEKYPWPRSVHVDYQIVIDVQRFDTNANKSQLIARWIIKDGETGRDLFASESEASSPVTGAGTGVSQALSGDLATMSREIAAQLVRLELQHPPTQPAKGQQAIKPLSSTKLSLSPPPTYSITARSGSNGKCISPARTRL